MHIIEDDLSGIEIRELLEIHFAGMLSLSPRGACHFLDIDALKGPTVTFWSVRDKQAVAGCGALKELDSQHGEIKSMRTHPNYLRQGVASLLVDHIITTAKSRGYGRLSLETGSGDAFVPAIRLYEARGFRPCTAFGGYAENPFSRFYDLKL